MSTIASPPAQDSLIELDERLPWLKNPLIMAKGWLQWLQDAVLKRVQASPEILLGDYQLLGQGASIVAAGLPLPALGAGTYEVTSYMRVTTADGVSSSVALAIGWTENGLALSAVLGTIASDSVIDPRPNMLARITIDANSPIIYATAYASNTPGKMKYRLGFTVKAITG